MSQGTPGPHTIPAAPSVTGTPTPRFEQVPPYPGAEPGAATPRRRSFWTVPKALLAAGIAVLLAGGGGAVGYSMGQADAAHKISQRFQNRRFGGQRQGGLPGEGIQGGQGQPASPSGSGVTGS